MIRCTFLLLVLYTLEAVPAASLETLMQAGHWKRARAAAEDRLKVNPNDAEALFTVARAKRAFGDAAGGILPAEKALQSNPQSPKYHTLLADMTCSSAGAAGLLGGLRLVRQCRKELDAALALDSDYVEALWSQMIFYFRAPSVVGGSKTEARRIAKRIQVLSPARGADAFAYIAETDSEREEFFLKAAEVAPGRYESKTRLADFYMVGNKHADLAEKYAREALDLDATRIDAYAILASVYARQGRRAELDQIVGAGERAIPDDLTPYLRAGEALGADDPKHAEVFFRKYLTQEPEGFAPRLCDAHFGLALAIEKLGRKAEAISELQIALREEPDNKMMKDALKRLKR